MSDPIKTKQAESRILILRTGHTDPEVIRHHGDHDRWVTDTMTGMDCRFTVHHVPDRGIPDLRGHDGVVVTGTAASVTDRAPWMAGLGELLAGAGGDAPPVLALCFAAQLAADALGGRVKRNPRGWEIGTVTVELTEAGRGDPLFRGLPPAVEVQTTHEDHIAELPAEATLLAGNRKTPVQAFAQGDRTPTARGRRFRKPVMRLTSCTTASARAGTAGRSSPTGCAASFARPDQGPHNKRRAGGLTAGPFQERDLFF
jgi:GMP synthase (glutamine-hydrolysing)